MCNDYSVEYLGGISFSKDLLLLSESGKSLFPQDDSEIQMSVALKQIQMDYEELIDKIKTKLHH